MKIKGSIRLDNIDNINLETYKKMPIITLNFDSSRIIGKMDDIRIDKEGGCLIFKADILDDAQINKIIEKYNHHYDISGITTEKGCDLYSVSLVIDPDN